MLPLGSNLKRRDLFADKSRDGSADCRLRLQVSSRSIVRTYIYRVYLYLPVQLIDQLQHGALYLVVTAGTVIEASATDGVDLVEEDQAGLLASRHFE